jgi:hypothetical protein
MRFRVDERPASPDDLFPVIYGELRQWRVDTSTEAQESHAAADGARPRSLAQPQNDETRTGRGARGLRSERAMRRPWSTMDATRSERSASRRADHSTTSSGEHGRRRAD